MIRTARGSRQPFVLRLSEHEQDLTVLQKVGIRTFSSFRRKPKSREFKQLQFPWTRVFTGVTTFCVIVRLCKRLFYKAIFPGVCGCARAVRVPSEVAQTAQRYS